MASQFTFDPNRCTGCQACVVACWMENRTVQSRPWRVVHPFNAFGHPDLPSFHLSFACHHCEAPACLEHCPADAYTKDAQTGAVTIHADRCMGCRYCTWACPHDAPKFRVRSEITLTIAGGQPRDPTRRVAKEDVVHPSSHSTQSGARLAPALRVRAAGRLHLRELASGSHASRGVRWRPWRRRGPSTWNHHASGPPPCHARPALRTIVKAISERTLNSALGTIEKCTFCPERLAKGLEPACVARCPMEALGFTPLNPARPLAEVPGLPPSKTAPAIHVLPLRRPVPPSLGRRPPEASLRAFLKELLEVPHPKITLRGEWTLLLFTTAISVLAAWMGASRLGGPPVHPWAFLTLGGLVMALSTAHLGRPERAWRAMLHLRTSWLSREVASVSAFLGLGALALFVLPGLGWLAAAAGFLALFAIDRIYRVALRTGPWNLHSAHTLFNGLYLLGLLAGIPALALSMGLLKAGLYLHRKHHFAGIGKPVRPWVSALRLGTGFLGPLALAASHSMQAGALATLAAALALLGDLIDRGEYYDELDVATPQGELAREVRHRAQAAVER